MRQVSVFNLQRNLSKELEELPFQVTKHNKVIATVFPVGMPETQGEVEKIKTESQENLKENPYLVKENEYPPVPDYIPQSEVKIVGYAQNTSAEPTSLFGWCQEHFEKKEHPLREILLEDENGNKVWEKRVCEMCIERIRRHIETKGGAMFEGGSKI